MKTLKCIIVDDEALARQVVRTYLEDLPEYEIIAECKNAIEAMNILSSKDIDLMFLDINMPKLSGLSFLKTLGNPPLVIITTAYKEYALEGYELNVVDYLNKPFSFERFLKSLAKVKERIAKPDISLGKDEIRQESHSKVDFVFIKADKKTYKLSFNDILYIEALGDYVKIYTTEEIIVSYITLKRLEQILPYELFPRVHKSYIISLSKIKSIEGNMVNIEDKKITIGASYRKNFFALIQSHSI